MNEWRLNPKTAGARRRFDPALFFETAAKGRSISKHRKMKSSFRRVMTLTPFSILKKAKSKSP